MKNDASLCSPCPKPSPRSIFTFKSLHPSLFRPLNSPCNPLSIDQRNHQRLKCSAIHSGSNAQATAGEAHLAATDLHAPPPTQEPLSSLPQERVLRKLGVTQRRIEELEAFVAQHDHANVPYTYPGGLGRWSAEQRHRWRRGRLPTATFRALSALGFPFDAQTSRWAARFSQLADFHSIHGHCNVPHGDPEVPEGLYAWILVQRQLYRQERLLDERSRRLEGLGFVWEPDADRWERRFSELEAFVKKHGHARVPRGWRESPSLAAWVGVMRAQWKGRDGERAGLSHSQEARLRDIGFEFGRHVSWEMRLAQLDGVRVRQGHLRGRLPNKGAFEGLGDWAKRQRAAWRAGKLPLERAVRLEEIGFELDPEDAAWRRGLGQLDGQLERRGFTAVFVSLKVLGGRSLLRAEAAAQPTVEALALWHEANERAASAGRLPPERIAALAKRGFILYVKGEER